MKLNSSLVLKNINAANREFNETILLVLFSSVFFKRTDHETAQTIYRVKHSLFDDYMKAEFRSPALVCQALNSIIA